MERFAEEQKELGLKVVEATFQNVKDTLELVLVDCPQFKEAVDQKIKEFCWR